jgi:hypothetical protein
MATRFAVKDEMEAQVLFLLLLLVLPMLFWQTACTKAIDFVAIVLPQRYPSSLS